MSRGIDKRVCTVVSFLLRGGPLVLGPINLVVSDEELLLDLFI